MAINLERVRRNIHDAETSDLLDRITAYRQGMDPEAVSLIEEELRQRGVTAEDLLAHADHLKRSAIYLPNGTAARCSACTHPASVRTRGWHYLWGWLPVIPQTYYYCAKHAPSTKDN